MSKNILKFEVEENKITALSRNPLPTNSINVSMANFIFDETWKNYSKIAVFRVVLPEETIEKEVSIPEDTLTCVIPWEVLLYPRQKLFCGVYGLLNGRRITTNYTVACMMVRGPAHPEESKPFEPDQYESIMNEIHNISNQATRAINYNENINKPRIEGIELSGDITLDQIGGVYKKKYISISELSKILI